MSLNLEYQSVLLLPVLMANILFGRGDRNQDAAGMKLSIWSHTYRLPGRPLVPGVRLYHSKEAVSARLVNSWYERNSSEDNVEGLKANMATGPGTMEQRLST